MAGDYEILCRCCPLLITECVTASEGTCSLQNKFLVPLSCKVDGEREGGGLIFCFSVLLYNRENVSY